MHENADARSKGAAAMSAEVTLREEVARGIHVLQVHMDWPAAVPRPGQFYQVDCGGGREHLLPRPIGAHGVTVDRDGLSVRFLVESVGWGTATLCSLTPGEAIRLLGPLGRGFGMPERGKALLVSGGVGVAPLFYLARVMEAEAVAHDLLAGFVSRDRYYPAVQGLDCHVDLFTDDGSLGNKGLVCEAVAGRLDVGDYSKVYTCGPDQMMKIVASECGSRGVPCEVSLDSRMACGIGACRGCVREGAGGKNICVCTDGPVFDARDVGWVR